MKLIPPSTQHADPGSESASVAPTRIVHAVDAIQWLKDSPVLDGSSLFGSLPDYSEFPELTIEEWKEWFRSTAQLLFLRTPGNGVTLFFQSDIKHNGAWIDKAYLVQRAAEESGSTLLWHKIICRSQPDRPTFGRPSFSHLLCFSKDLKESVEWATADVVSDMGEKTWARGTGSNAAKIAATYVKKHTDTRTLVNLFCGEGMVLAVANSLGLNAVGVERSRKRAEKALRFRLETK